MGKLLGQESIFRGRSGVIELVEVLDEAIIPGYAAGGVKDEPVPAAEAAIEEAKPPIPSVNGVPLVPKLPKLKPPPPPKAPPPPPPAEPAKKSFRRIRG